MRIMILDNGSCEEHLLIMEWSMNRHIPAKYMDRLALTMMLFLGPFRGSFSKHCCFQRKHCIYVQLPHAIFSSIYTIYGILTLLHTLERDNLCSHFKREHSSELKLFRKYFPYRLDSFFGVFLVISCGCFMLNKHHFIRHQFSIYK